MQKDRRRIARKKWAASLPPEPLEGGEGEILLCCLLLLLCVLLHALLLMLLAFLHKLKRLLPLLWSKQGIDLRPCAFLLHNQVSHKLSLLAGEGAGLVLVKTSVHVCVFRLLVLAELLHHGFDLGLFVSHDA